MPEIVAYKNGNKKHFSESAWKLMPADKYGWVADSFGVIERLQNSAQIGGEPKTYASETIYRLPEEPENKPESMSEAFIRLLTEQGAVFVDSTPQKKHRGRPKKAPAEAVGNEQREY
jgi:hypothetical protein